MNQERIRDAAAEIEERVRPQIEQVRETLGDWKQRALKLMKERPGTSLLLAVGAGFLVGRLVSRR
jgi:ElaB/YqjD/DUF883 family membrane-anchored ribosome-binding protein